MFRQLALALILLVVSLGVFAKNGIPREYMNNPAIDLVYKGKLLLPEEANDLVLKSRGHFDLANIDPDTTSDIWKPVYPIKDEDKTDNLPFEDLDTVAYHSPVNATTTGKFRFNIVKDGKIYIMMLSKTAVHSALLAKSLLRKIGYQVPPVKRLGKVKIKFKNLQEKKSFISYLTNIAFLGDPDSWIIEDLAEDELMLQDALVMPAYNIIYNLATGPIDAGIIQGRRLLSSLIVPLTITNLSESVNMLRWTVGRIEDNTLQLDIDNPERFETNWEDIRWIGKRIEKLKPSDWEEVVESTHLPKPVQMILLEKIKSRRNSMMKLLSIDAKEFPVSSNVNYGVELVKGKLTQETWTGYASRFAYGDPDSPLADSEMSAWVQSRALTTFLDTALNQINQLPYLGTDIKKMNEEKSQIELTKAAQKSLETGVPADKNVRSWIFPTVRGQLILSRNLVAGPYMGTDMRTDSILQMVDVIGVSIGAGAYLGTDNLPIGMDVSASAEASFTRTYAHLRPVTSIEQSLKYKFKNIMVPIVKADVGKKIHEATVLKFDKNISEEKKQEKIKAALKPFKDMLLVGESFLVSDSLGANAGGRLGINYLNLMKVSLGLATGVMQLSRFHVHRKSEDVIQIYKDSGRLGYFQPFFSLDSLIPVLKVSFKKTNGSSKTKFYSLNINHKNPQVLENLSAVRQALVKSGTKEVDKLQRPYLITHDFKEKNPKFNLLFWQWEKLKSGTQMMVKSPEGVEKTYLRQTSGGVSGKNYQTYASNLVAHWMGLIFKRPFSFDTGSSGNPGFSFKGTGKTTQITYDQEIHKDGTMGEGFINLSRHYTGWSITRDKAQKLIDQLINRYRYDFFSGPVLNDTRRMFLYNISFNMMIYNQGIDNLLLHNESKIKMIFTKHELQEDLTVNPAFDEDAEEQKDEGNKGSRRFWRSLTKYRKDMKNNKLQNANAHLLAAITEAEKRLTLEGWAELLGGKENFYTKVKVDGFREGDEDGDRSISSSSFGEYGSPQIQGPLYRVLEKTGMLEGEFFIYWLMTRLI